MHEPENVTAAQGSAGPFRLFVDSVVDYGLALLTPDDSLASRNFGAARMTGHGAGDVLGRAFSTLFVARDVAAGKPQTLLAAAGAQQ